jgi:hypothetical protein
MGTTRGLIQERLDMLWNVHPLRPALLLSDQTFPDWLPFNLEHLNARRSNILNTLRVILHECRLSVCMYIHQGALNHCVGLLEAWVPAPPYLETILS